MNNATLVDLFQETAGVALGHLTPLEPCQCVRQCACDFSTCQRHVKEASFFFKFRTAFHGHLRGEQLLFQPDDVHVFEFEPLGGMHRHEAHLVVVVVLVVCVGQQGDVDQKVRQGLGVFVGGVLHEALERVQQFLDVFVACHAFRGFVAVQSVD